MDFQQAVIWYSGLARKPGWADYVWDRVRELAAEHPEMFEMLPQILSATIPWLSQTKLGRSNATRANTFRIPADYFPGWPMPQTNRRRHDPT